ncbi:DUF4148 domain-containing protein [Trinickia sp.]|uniref:DUF4148 domain-containing protein n=1 Tax=Trinickia sp. TaxID=2571163 RepID=UPI003F7DDBDB
MKCSIRTVALALAFVPAAVFAQSSNQPLTRAQVQDQLIQLRQNGYKPSKLHYPADIQAAEARTAAQGDVNAPSTGFGGASTGTMQSGSPMTPRHTWRSMYDHH